MSAKTMKARSQKIALEQEATRHAIRWSSERKPISDVEAATDVVSAQGELTPADVPGLQRTVGNQNTLQLIQAKSAIGAAQQTRFRENSIQRQGHGSARHREAGSKSKLAIQIRTDMPFSDTITVGSTGYVFLQSYGIDAELNPKGDRQIDYQWNVKVEDPNKSVRNTKISVDNPYEAAISWEGLKPGSAKITPLLEIRQKNHKPLIVKGNPLSVVVTPVTAKESLEQATGEYKNYLTEYEKYADKFAKLQGRESRGENVGTEIEKENSGEIKRYEGARQKAEEAASVALDISKKKQLHDVIASLLSSIDQSISIIETAKAVGYEEAINLLNAEELEKSPSTDSFWIAFAGNLLWALSGSIPGGGAAALAMMKLPGLKNFFGKNQNVSTHVATLIGVVGAMTAQFSSGLPSAGQSKVGIKRALLQQFGSLNTQIANAQRRTSRLVLLEAMSSDPPTETTDPVEYIADLSVGLRYHLYGDLYEKGLNDGALPSHAKVKDSARNELLHQYVAGNAAISRGEVIPSRSGKQGGENLIEQSIKGLGGQKALSFGEYELVENQIFRAASDLGIQISRDTINKAVIKLKAGEDYSIPVPAPDKHRIKQLLWQRIVVFSFRGEPDQFRPRPDRGADEEKWAASLVDKGSIKLWIVNKDLVKLERNGKTIYSPRRFFLEKENELPSGEHNHAEYTIGNYSSLG
jgi:hypothetical protein